MAGYAVRKADRDPHYGPWLIRYSPSSILPQRGATQPQADAVTGYDVRAYAIDLTSWLSLDALGSGDHEHA
jgi:hypothetical protein